jgi:bacterioferritin-associated ferredoxin
LTLIFNFNALDLTHVLPVRGQVLLERESMIVCHCYRVTDRTIRAVIDAGAETEEAVADMCGAGSCCGGCVPAVSELLDRERKACRRLQVLTSAA